VEVPEGIDTGFGYNVGRAAWGEGAQRQALEKHGPFERLKGWADEDPKTLPPLQPTPPRAPLAIRTARNEAELREMFRRAIGSDSAILTDPVGGHINVTQAIVDHIIEQDSRSDGREAYFPLIPEIIQAPQEIWAGFAQNPETGMVVLRTRYVRLFELSKNVVVGLVADADAGQWSGYTFFRGSKTALKNLRTGLRIYPV
ncbi:PBECR2 nuclease fold domain-containing protein, partial [Telmatospirillum sp. J64-1]|uniref:PBECR2 nuclease fold domain-containing protein n=1 Tax=Telmatospirillum sp. J64-1 TaxID=2502183 RepID=UPI00163D4A4D